MMYHLRTRRRRRRRRKRCKGPAANQHVKRLVDLALRSSDSLFLFAEVCCIDNCDSKMALYTLKLLQGDALFAQLPGTYSPIFQLKTNSSLFSIVFEGLLCYSNTSEFFFSVERDEKKGFNLRFKVINECLVSR